MQRRKEFFNSVAHSWDGFGHPAPEKLERVVKAAGIKPGDRILDVGSGTGLLVPLLLEITGGKSRICAIDYAEEMVKVMESRNFPPNVEVKLMDIQRTAFRDETFDCVIANSCYPHFRSKKRALGEILRILKKGGSFVLSHPDGRGPVNRRHRNEESVRKDILPPASVLGKTLEEAGFTCAGSVDEEEFYLINCLK